MPPRSRVIPAALLASSVAFLTCAAACDGARAELLPPELTAFAVRDTVWPGDSLLVGWTLRNPGARRRFRDDAAFYRITLVGPNGRVVAPAYDRRGRAAFGERTRDLGPGAEVRHLVDLGCVTEPLIPRSAAADGAGGCALRYDRPAPGAYQVVIRHVPPPPPDGSRATEFEPSGADTVALYVAPGAPGAARPE